MDTRRTILTTLAIGAGMAAWPAAAQQGEIKIGEVNSYSGLPAFTEPYRKGLQLAVDEVNAKGGVLGKKLVVITGAGQVGRIEVVAGAVASYITGAYFFTSSTSFANPAVTIGRALTDSFAGISPASVLPFIGAQIVGAVLAIGLCRVVFERSDEQTNRSVSLHP